MEFLLIDHWYRSLIPSLKHPNKHILTSNIIYLTVLSKFDFWVACQPTIVPLLQPYERILLIPGPGLLSAAKRTMKYGIEFTV